MTTPPQSGYNILILEDEVIIADTLARHLTRNGHHVVGTAISYEDAVRLYEETHPDLALLDIRIDGPKSGVDFAHFLRGQPRPIPFIFLTSQTDAHHIAQVRETFPKGYLSKPIQVGSLLATVEVAMHNHRADADKPDTVVLRDGRHTYRLPVESITYLQASHVYVRVNLVDQPVIMLRSTLSDLIEELGEEQFLQTHRSYVVNLAHVTRYDKESIYVNNKAIPVSRTRRSKVLSRL
ncbi:DNA-binding LytR/AlgR family response regulator [Lewinella marina]|uniref:DNA-binding response regulator n=1 Tax=Neolewinella marina TaxID=438751 RepID=A0A2G0CIG2_9BACT|nr:response regulator [Neolewinella marina]NJB85086.1 DNA-binding LytR/AlgR family response regulator [Neolewinella marina]PHK99774.1 hypothetical protein CGL56_01615 [Neolewinella marina]